MDENGESIIVEIDEAKFGKTKVTRGHHGHPVEGVWVFRIVERTARRRCFFITVPNRTALILIPIIRRYVREGSTIYSDQWRPYRRLGALGVYQHFDVNHSREFTNEIRDEDGFMIRLIHTNTIEGLST